MVLTGIKVKKYPQVGEFSLSTKRLTYDIKYFYNYTSQKLNAKIYLHIFLRPAIFHIKEMIKYRIKCNECFLKSLKKIILFH